MAHPTPQTLECIRMFRDGNTPDTILSYLNANQRHIDVNYRPADRYPMIYSAAVYNNKKLIKKVLQMGTRIDEELASVLMIYITFVPPTSEAKIVMDLFINAGFPKNIMLCSICNNISATNKELLNIILEEPVDINYKYKTNTPIHMFINNNTPIHILIRSYYVFYKEHRKARDIFLEMLHILIQNGADPNEVNNEGKTAFQIVNEKLADHNPGPILQILQEGAPAANHPTPINYNKLWEDELKKPSPDLAKLEEYKNLGNIPKSTITTALRNQFVKNPNIQLIETLLKLGANPNAIGSEFRPMFFKIFYLSNKDIMLLINLLSNYGLDVNLSSSIRNCIFEYISAVNELSNIASIDIKFTNEHKEVLNLLIEKGADIHYTNSLYSGNNILDHCIKYFPNAVEFFLQKGLPVVKKGQTLFYTINTTYMRDVMYGITEVHIKNAKFNKTFLQMLLKYHTDHDDYFKDFLDGAITYRKEFNSHLYKEIKDVLSPNYNKIYSDGKTPLIKAVQIHTNMPQKWAFDMIQDFLTKGADKNYIDPTGKKAVDYTRNSDVQELLNPKLLDPEFKILWTGFSKADIAFTNEIFHQTTHASNLAQLNPDESLFPFVLYVSSISNTKPEHVCI